MAIQYETEEQKKKRLEREKQQQNPNLFEAASRVFPSVASRMLPGGEKIPDIVRNVKAGLFGVQLPRAGKDMGPSRSAPMSRSMFQDKEEPGIGMEEEKSFMDYLNQARGMGGGAPTIPGADYSGLISQAKSNAGRGDERLNAMYSQLRNSFEADAPNIQANYDGAVAAHNANAEQSKAAIDSAHASSNEAQAKQLAALGIQDTAGVLAAAGNASGGDRAQALSNLEQNRASSTNRLEGNKASSGVYNTRLGQAAGAEGTSRRADLQQSLADKLASIQLAQTQDAAQTAAQNAQLQAQGESQLWSRAGQLADWDNAAAQRRRGPSAKDELELQLLAGKAQGQTLSNQKLEQFLKQPAGQSSSQMLIQLQQLAPQFGVDPADTEAMAEFSKLLGSTSKIRT